jgi:hypothetical protein
MHRDLLDVDFVGAALLARMNTFEKFDDFDLSRVLAQYVLDLIDNVLAADRGYEVPSPEIMPVEMLDPRKPDPPPKRRQPVVDSKDRRKARLKKGMEVVSLYGKAVSHPFRAPADGWYVVKIYPDDTVEIGPA